MPCLTPCEIHKFFEQMTLFKGASIRLILPPTVTFKGVRRFACLMLFSKMLDVFRESGLIAKAKKQQEEDDAREKHYATMERRNGVKLKNLMDQLWSKAVNQEQESPEGALEDMMNLMNQQFADVINHDEDEEDLDSDEYDEHPVITPAQSEWLIKKYNTLKLGHVDETERLLAEKDAGNPALAQSGSKKFGRTDEPKDWVSDEEAVKDEDRGAESDFPFTEDDLEPTVDTNSHAGWLGLISNSIPNPDKSIESLLYSSHAAGGVWNSLLTNAVETGAFKLDQEGMRRQRDNQEAARMQRDAFASHAERGLKQGEAQDMGESAAGYDKFFSETRIKPRGDEEQETKILPIGRFDAMASNLADRIKEHAEDEARKQYDEYHKDTADARRAEITEPYEKKIRGLSLARLPAETLTRLGIDNLEAEMNAGLEEFDGRQATLKQGLYKDAMGEKFRTMQSEVNNHARSALGTKNIGTKGGKSGSTPHMVTPAMKQIAKLLDLPCDSVNAPDIMNEPLKSMFGDTPRDATSHSYLSALGVEIEEESKIPFHSALSISMGQGGRLSRATGHVWGDSRGGKGDDSRQAGDKGSYSIADDIYGDSNVPGRSDSGFSSQEQLTNEEGEDVFGEEGNAVSQDDGGGGGMADRVDDNNALGSGMGHVRDAKSLRRTVGVTGGNSWTERSKDASGSNLHDYKEELKQQVYRGDITNEQAKSKLSNMWVNSDNFDESDGAIIHSLDDVPEVHDPSHILYGKSAEDRLAWGKKVMDGVMGVHAALLSLGAMNESKSDESQSFEGKSYTPASLGDLKSLFTAPSINEHGEDERVDEHEARMANQQRLGKFLEDRSDLMQKFEQVGIEPNMVVDELIRVVQKRGRKRQAWQSKKDEEPLSDSKAFNDALINIMTSGARSGHAKKLSDEDMDRIDAEYNKAKEVLDTAEQKAYKNQDWGPVEEARKVFKEAQAKRNGMYNAPGSRSSMLPFAKGIFYTLKGRIDKKEADMKYINKTQEQSHDLMNGGIESKKDCDACVGSREHFVSEDQKDAFKSSHEKVRAAHGGRSPFVHMPINLPDLKFVSKGFEGDNPDAPTLKNITEYLGLDWDKFKNRSEHNIQESLYDNMVRNEHKIKNISEHFNMVPRSQNRKPVGAARANPAYMTLMAQLFPHEANAFRAKQEEEHIKTRQRKSITGALNMWHELKETGFKPKSKDPRKVMTEILRHGNADEYGSNRQSLETAKEMQKKVWDKHNDFNTQNSKILAQYSRTREELAHMHKTQGTSDPELFASERKLITDKMAKIALNVTIPKGYKSKGEGNEKNLDVLNQVYNDITNADKAVTSARNANKDLEAQEGLPTRIDENALGAFTAMPEIKQFYNQSRKQGDEPITEAVMSKFVESMMKQYYTAKDGQPMRSVYSGSMRPHDTKATSAADVDRRNDVPSLHQVDLGLENKLRSGSGETIRHGGDEGLGSIFSAVSGIYAMPHVKNLAEIPAILEKMKEFGWKSPHENPTDEKSHIEKTKEFFDQFNEQGTPLPSAISEDAPAEEDDGLMSEEDARKRNHSDMSINADKRNNENKLGTASHCGYCRGYGSVDIERLSNYFSSYNDDLEYLNHHDDEMMHYISKNGRPVNTKSFDHHREKHGKDAYADHEHAGYACPDCQHGDESVSGGLISDGLCNHCLGRGEIDPTDDRRMKVLINEKVKHAQWFGDHATLEDIQGSIEHGSFSKSLSNSISKILSGDKRLKGLERDADDNPDKTMEDLLSTFPQIGNDSLLPLQMFMESAHQGEFPNVLTSAEIQHAKEKVDAADEKRGHLSSIRSTWDKSPGSNVGIEEEREARATRQETDPMREAMQHLPKHAVHKLVNGTHKKLLSDHMTALLEKMKNFGASDEVLAEAQESIDTINNGVHMELKPNSKFGLGGSAHFGSGNKYDDANVSLNHLFNNLQEKVHTAYKNQLNSNQSQSKEISQLENPDNKDLFGKKHTFNQELLRYHKGAMMTAAEVRLFDDEDGWDAHEVSPHDVEQWFARNSNPDMVKSLKKDWRKKLKTKGGLWGALNSDEEPDIKTTNTDPTNVPFNKKQSDITGALIRRGSIGVKAHAHDTKRAEKMMKSLQEMQEANIDPFVGMRQTLPVSSEHAQLAKELGVAQPKDKLIKGAQFHPMLNEFSEESQKWFVPTMPVDPDNPEGYQEKTESPPIHREFDDNLKYTLDREFDELVDLKILKRYIDDPDAEHGLTADAVRQMQAPAEEGGNPKEWSKIKSEIKKIRENSSKGGVYTIGGDTLSKKEYRENRESDLQDRGSQPVTWAKAKDSWEGVGNMIKHYFDNYDNDPRIARDKELVKFGTTMYKTKKYPTASMVSLFGRNDIKSNADFKQKLQDPDFKEEYELTHGLASFQNRSWQMPNLQVMNHMRHLNNLEGMEDGRFKNAYGEASKPPSSPPQPSEWWEPPEGGVKRGVGQEPHGQEVFLNPTPKAAFSAHRNDVQPHTIHPLAEEEEEKKPEMTPEMQQELDSAEENPLKPPVTGGEPTQVYDATMNNPSLVGTPNRQTIEEQQQIQQQEKDLLDNPNNS